MDYIKIFVEMGKRWVFAGAVNWPGWCRRGKDESLAIQALLEAGSRYALAMAGSEVAFDRPMSIEAFKIVERVEGNTTTDFGAPDAALKSDDDPVSSKDLAQFSEILNGCWSAIDRAVGAAKEKELQKGPRGGGRSMAKIIDHIVDGDASYLGRIGWKAPRVEGLNPQERMAAMRKAILDGLGASARGELPMQGPRGGLRWPARRFVRRVAWHALDHAWEIEDRLG